MAIALYDVAVGSFLQVLGAVSAFMDKGLAHCKANDIDPASIVETRIYPDMQPFRFQIASVAHHTFGAVSAVQGGVFKPPSVAPDVDYAGLQTLVTEAKAGLQALSRDAVNALEGREVVFQLGERKMPFTAEDFLMTFSMPNVHFHATTAYDILRMKGVPIGKRDFLGAMRPGA